MHKHSSPAHSHTSASAEKYAMLLEESLTALLHIFFFFVFSVGCRRCLSANKSYGTFAATDNWNWGGIPCVCPPTHTQPHMHRLYEGHMCVFGRAGMMPQSALEHQEMKILFKPFYQHNRKSFCTFRIKVVAAVVVAFSNKRTNCLVHIICYWISSAAATKVLAWVLILLDFVAIVVRQRLAMAGLDVAEDVLVFLA